MGPSRHMPSDETPWTPPWLRITRNWLECARTWPHLLRSFLPAVHDRFPMHAGRSLLPWVSHAEGALWPWLRFMGARVSLPCMVGCTRAAHRQPLSLPGASPMQLGLQVHVPNSESKGRRRTSYLPLLNAETGELSSCFPFLLQCKWLSAMVWLGRHWTWRCDHSWIPSFWGKKRIWALTSTKGQLHGERMPWCSFVFFIFTK